MKKILWIMVIALLLCACSTQTPQETNTETDATSQTTEPAAPETTTQPQQTEPAVTVPLVPDNTDYTGPTLNASEGAEVWDETTGTTASTTPESTTPPTTQPSTEPTTSEESQLLTYEQYMALPTSKQQEYFLSFGDVDAFYNWLEAAEAEYEKNHPEEGGDGNIDIGDYMGNGG